MLRFFLIQLYKYSYHPDWIFTSVTINKNIYTLNMYIFVLAVQKNTHYMMIFDAFVILTCLASLILCTRSVIKGIWLQRVGIAPSLESLVLCKPY